MNQSNTPATLASQTIAVEHIRISSERSFAEVRHRLEETLPTLDATIAGALGSGDQRRATDYEANGPKLSIFEQRSHGALLQIVGRKCNPEAQKRFQASLKRRIQTRDAEMDLSRMLGYLGNNA